LREGDVRTAIVSRALDPAALLAEVGSAANGAAILFVGTVRNVNDGRPVTGIEYTAYVAMAERELRAIAHEASARFGTSDIVVEHRIGQLTLGEASVVIAVAHPHRAPAYEASRYIIEELKRRVPIWKREAYADGTREWVGAGSGKWEAGSGEGEGNFPGGSVPLPASHFPLPAQEAST
jgi:molybdopterin synthase catalytic subunit